MKIYIAGKYTGIPHEQAVAKFNATEQQLIETGLQPNEIINPVKHVPQNTQWSDAMKICIPLLESCTAIFMQNDWLESFGARRELSRAMELRLDLFFEQQKDMALISNLIGTGV